MANYSHVGRSEICSGPTCTCSLVIQDTHFLGVTTCQSESLFPLSSSPSSPLPPLAIMPQELNSRPSSPHQSFQFFSSSDLYQESPEINITVIFISSFIFQRTETYTLKNSQIIINTVYVVLDNHVFQKDLLRCYFKIT